MTVTARLEHEGLIVHLDKLGHVPDQVVVNPLVVQHDDGVHLEGLAVVAGDVGDERGEVTLAMCLIWL